MILRSRLHTDVNIKRFVDANCAVISYNCHFTFIKYYMFYVEQDCTEIYKSSYIFGSVSPS